MLRARNLPTDSPLYKPHGGAQAAAGRAAFDPALAGADGYDPKAKGGGEFLALDMGQQQDQMLLMESGGNVSASENLVWRTG